MTRDAIIFTVFGTPEPGGSKRGFVVNGRAVLSDANPRAKGWKSQVALAARQAYAGPLVDGPLAVSFVFIEPRPRGHYGTGRNVDRLKPSAPPVPAKRPDLLKLARSVEDALSGVIYRDDAQIVSERLLKRYGEPARCEVTIRPFGAVERAQEADLPQPSSPAELHGEAA